MRALYAARGEAAIDLHKAPSLDLRVEAWRDDLAMVERVAPGLELARRGLRRGLDAFEAERAAPVASVAGSRSATASTRARVPGQEAAARG